MGAPVTIIELGVGNVRSVVNACARVGAEPVVARSGDELLAQAPERIVLPGVGAIGVALENLRARGFEDALERLVRGGGARMLGICVGMQMLAEECEEFGLHKGLGWVPGRVRRLEPEGALKVPHVGWNDVEPAAEDPVFAEIEREHFYFVHSYALECPDAYAVARADYGGRFVCAVRAGPVAGVQFHPEKSSRAGERLLANFLAG